MDEYQLRREALFDAEVSAVQNGNTEEFYRINAEISALDDKFRNVQEVKETSRFRKFGNYILGGLAVTGLALTGAAKDMAGSSLEDSVDSLFAGSNDAQMVNNLSVNQTVTNGDYVANLEDNRLINIINIESGSEVQISGNHYEVGSMAIDGDLLQYTTRTLQGNEGIYQLNEINLTTGEISTLKEETSADTPDFYVNQDTDGVNNVYVDNGAVVVNGEIVYTLGNNSLPSLNGDSVAFASEQTENNETTQNVVLVENGEINTIYSGNQSVEFVEFLDGNVVYGLENLLDNKTVDLHVGDAVREVPNGMFDADNGNLTWIEQTEDGFSINLYNFETDQTENIYVSTAEMRNPQISGDLVTWEQNYELSDSFKAWYSNVTDLMNLESIVSVDNGTVDNGTVDNGIVDNGTDIANTPNIPETTKTETEDNNYLGMIAAGTGAGLLGIGYFAGKRRDKKMANEVASIVEDRLGAAASANELNRVSDQLEILNKSIETYVLSNERLEAQGSELYSQSKETQDLVDFLGAVEQPDYAPKLDEISEQVSGIKEVVDSWNKPKLPILKVDVDKTEELEQREARCADLESILEDREARVKSESNKNKVKNVAGKLYFVLGGIAIAGAAVYGEYTGITDFVDYSYLRG
jgi:hypothetical protein